MYSSKEHLDFYSSKIMLVNILLWFVCIQIPFCRQAYG
jgi:hypothetical protein